MHCFGGVRPRRGICKVHGLVHQYGYAEACRTARPAARDYHPYSFFKVTCPSWYRVVAHSDRIAELQSSCCLSSHHASRDRAHFRVFQVLGTTAEVGSEAPFPLLAEIGEERIKLLRGCRLSWSSVIMTQEAHAPPMHKLLMPAPGPDNWTHNVAGCISGASQIHPSSQGIDQRQWRQQRR